MNILKGQHWAVIPSRANSQRFPGKALALLDRESLIERTIDTVMLATKISRAVVSTNDKTLVKELPDDVSIHWRPNEYAKPDTRIDDTLRNMIETSDEIGEFLHLVQLTSPFIHYSHIEESILILDKMESVDSVQLVTSIPNTYHAFSQRCVESGKVKFCYPEEREKYYNSQLKPTHYAFAGYVGFRTKSLLRYGNIWGEKSLPIIGSPECTIDIDTLEDLEYAEFILRRRGKHVSGCVEETEKSYGSCVA